MLVRLSPSFSYLNEGYSSIFALNCEVHRLGQTGWGGGGRGVYHVGWYASTTNIHDLCYLTQICMLHQYNPVFPKLPSFVVCTCLSYFCQSKCEFK